MRLNMTIWRYWAKMLMIEIQTTTAEQNRRRMQQHYAQTMHQEGGFQTLELLRDQFRTEVASN